MDSYKGAAQGGRLDHRLTTRLWLLAVVGLLAAASTLFSVPGLAFATQPVAMISGYEDGWNNGPLLITITTDRTGDPETHVYYRIDQPPADIHEQIGWFIDDPTWTQYQDSPFAVTGEGYHLFQYIAFRSGCCDGGEPDNFIGPLLQTMDLKIDFSRPVSSIRGLPSEMVQPGPQSFTIDATDTYAGVASTYYRINGGQPVACSAGTTVSIDASMPISMDYWSVDGAGNVESPRHATIEVDDGLPHTKLSGIPIGWSNSDVVFGLLGQSSQSSITATYYRLGSDPVNTYDGPVTVSAEGITTLAYRSTDAANEEPTQTTDIKVDKTSPSSVMHGVPADWSSTAVTLTIDASDTLSGIDSVRYTVNGGVPNRYWGPIKVSTAGTSTIDYWAVDQAGNMETPHTVQVLVDPGPTMSSSTIPNIWNLNDVTVTLYAWSPHYPVSNIYYDTGTGVPTTYTVPVVVSAEGLTDLTFWGVNSIGTTGPVTLDKIRIDKEPPVSTAFGIPVGWMDGDVHLTINASDAGSGVSSVHYQLGGSAPATYTTPINLALDGVTPLTYWAVDKSGKVEAAHSAEVRIDKNPPTSQISGIPTGWTRDGATFSLSASDTASGVSAIDYQLGGGPVEEYQAPVTVTAEGTTTVTWWAIDALGHSESPHTSLIRISKAAPVTSILGASQGWSNSDVTFSLSALSDHYGVAGTYYQVGTGLEIPYSAPVTLSSEGDNLITFYSIDDQGARELPKTANVRIDKTPPSTTLTDNPHLLVAGASRSFSLSSADSASGVAAIYYSLNYGPVLQYSSDVTISAPGTTTVIYWASDVAGNFETLHFATYSIASPVKLASKLTIGTSASAPRVGTTFVLSGRATPNPGMVGQTMHVDVMKPGSGRWSYSSNRVIYGSGGLALWQYKYKLPQTIRKGLYRFRAVYSGPDYRSFTSGYVSVTVR